jgi:large subunit ribosomal protein L22
MLMEKETAKAAATNLPISFKHSVEIGKTVQGMEIFKAIRLLEDVIAKKKPLPFKRFNRKVAHKRGISAGRYPMKASKEIITVLKNASANAVQNNIDGDRAKIVSFVCGRAISKERRSTRRIGRMTNVYIEVEG